MYQLDREWGDSYVSQVTRILTQLLPYLVEINTASIEMDTKCATDFTIKLKGGNVAVRLRRPKYDFRDLTIRALRDSGSKTELAKIKEGHGFRYFYGWIDKNNRIAEWILVDLDKVREMGLLDKKRPLIDNYDGTYFIAISIAELEESDCLILSQLNNQIKKSRQVNPQTPFIKGVERAALGYFHDGRPRSALSPEEIQRLEDIQKIKGIQDDWEDDD